MSRSRRGENLNALGPCEIIAQSAWCEGDTVAVMKPCAAEVESYIARDEVF